MAYTQQLAHSAQIGLMPFFACVTTEAARTQCAALAARRAPDSRITVCELVTCALFLVRTEAYRHGALLANSLTPRLSFPQYCAVMNLVQAALSSADRTDRPLAEVLYALYAQTLGLASGKLSTARARDGGTGYAHVPEAYQAGLPPPHSRRLVALPGPSR